MIPTPMFWGTVAGTHRGNAVCQRKPATQVRRINAVLQHPDPKLPWMLGNLDREVNG